jgi:hypothetical protein
MEIDADPDAIAALEGELLRRVEDQRGDAPAAKGRSDVQVLDLGNAGLAKRRIARLEPASSGPPGLCGCGAGPPPSRSSFCMKKRRWPGGYSSRVAKTA